MSLEDKVRLAIKRESRVRLTVGRNVNQIQRVIKKYNDLKNQGLIEDDRYTISRPDVIGHCKYGHASL